MCLEIPLRRERRNHAGFLGPEMLSLSRPLSSPRTRTSVQLGIRNRAEGTPSKTTLSLQEVCFMTRCTLRVATCRTLHTESAWLSRARTTALQESEGRRRHQHFLPGHRIRKRGRVMRLASPAVWEAG